MTAHSTPRLASAGFRRALIPLDGSAAAEAVLPALAALACPLGLDVVLLRVVPAVPAVAMENPAGVLEILDRAKQDAERYLLRVADAPTLDGLRVLTAVRTGDVPEQIAEAASESQTDLIAMTTHGRGGLGGLLFGSVAEAVLRAVSIPVFMLRVSETEAQASTLAA